MRKAEPEQSGVKGIIKPDETYTLKQFMEITGRGRHAMRAARQRGLRVLKDGNRRLVRGQDYIDYLLKINDSGCRSGNN